MQLHLQGVGWTETANIYNLTYDNGYAGYARGFNSGGDVQVDFVVSGDKGWHFIDRPAETLAPFHLAFLME